KVGGLRSGKLIQTGLQSTVAALGMALAIRLFMPPWDRFLTGLALTSNLFRLLQVTGGIGLGVLVYLVFAALLRMDEIKLIKRMVRKRV
ncbi:MAG TPA: hypothetical protein DDZ55_05330, partial [Firmicutes bacterium]|nr:hypothetical protein [Bacillota bacterium]